MQKSHHIIGSRFSWVQVLGRHLRRALLSGGNVKSSNRIDVETMSENQKQDIGLMDGRSDRSRLRHPTAFDAVRAAFMQRGP